MKTPYSAVSVANTIINLAKEKCIDDLTPLKLQKLIYYCHAWFLALVGDPLIREPVEAWTYGPVISEIYHEFKGYGSKEITGPATTLEFTNDEWNLVASRVPKEDEEALNIINQVLDGYGKLSPTQLANLTHREGEPWEAIHRKFSGRLRSHIEIPNDMIKQYFRSLLTASESEA